MQQNQNYPTSPSQNFSQPVIQQSNQDLGQSLQAEIINPPIKYAGFWVRWGAYFIDGLIIFVLSLIPQLFFGFVGGLLIMEEELGREGLDLVNAILPSIFNVIIGWAYFVFMTYKYQATFGKKVFGLQVISEGGEKLNLGKIILRETIGKIISLLILYIGYLMAGFTPRKQALHDKLASTLVVYKNPGKKISKWIIVLIISLFILPLIAIILILSLIVFIGLNKARSKAQDAAIKTTLLAILPDAFLYKNENSSYKGYQPQFDRNLTECSGQLPVVNISADGEQMAIFIKSCEEENKYFCGNPETNLVTHTAEVDQKYVMSGATICNPTDTVETLPTDQEIPKENKLPVPSN